MAEVNETAKWLDQMLDNNKKSTDDIKILKIEEIYQRFHNTNIKIYQKMPEVFETDGTRIGYFISQHKNFIIEMSKTSEAARWILEKVEESKKNRVNYLISKQSFASVSEFSKVYNGKENNNESTVHRIS